MAVEIAERASVQEENTSQNIEGPHSLPLPLVEQTETKKLVKNEKIKEEPVPVEIHYVPPQEGGVAAINLQTGVAEVDPERVKVDAYERRRQTFQQREVTVPVSPRTSESLSSPTAQSEVTGELVGETQGEKETTPRTERRKLLTSVATVRSQTLREGEVTVAQTAEGALVAVASPDTETTYLVRAVNAILNEGGTQIIGGRINITARQRNPENLGEGQTQRTNTRIVLSSQAVAALVEANRGKIPELNTSPSTSSEPPMASEESDTVVPNNAVLRGSDTIRIGEHYPTMAQRKAANAALETQVVQPEQDDAAQPEGNEETPSEPQRDTPPVLGRAPYSEQLQKDIDLQLMARQLAENQGEKPEPKQKPEASKGESAKEKRDKRNRLVAALLIGAQAGLTFGGIAASLLIPGTRSLPAVNPYVPSPAPDSGHNWVAPEGFGKSPVPVIDNSDQGYTIVWDAARASLSQVEDSSQITTAQVDIVKDIIAEQYEKILVGPDHEVPGGQSVHGVTAEIAETVVACTNYADQLGPNTNPQLAEICTQMKQLTEVSGNTNVTSPDTLTRQLVGNLQAFWSRIRGREQ